jgi:hypothetical protein
MGYECIGGQCQTPNWMKRVLLATGCYHLLFAAWVLLMPHQWFELLGKEQPNHPLMWQLVGAIVAVFGGSLVAAAGNPVKHWRIVFIALLKFSAGIVGFGLALFHQEIPLHTAWIMVMDDLIWWVPFAVMLWTCVRALTGVPPTRSIPLEISEAAETFSLSNGQTLAEASREKTLALVFLRHFGCTFTRQILRGLERIEKEAAVHGAELVLVHMLQSGKEAPYLVGGVRRIADPRCELYRAFGLGKGGFLELFGPHVWWRGALSIFKGCGVGHLAGDGMQMPGAFLFRDGKIVAAQPAHSASDLPDLPLLFATLPAPVRRDTVPA